MLEKIQFQNGTIVNKEYLNEVQKGPSFSADNSRENFYSEPTEAEHNSWDIVQRDRLKDWEIADPRQDPQTSIGRLAHDGVVINSYNPQTLEKVWGPPALSEIVEGSGVYGVWVEGGSIIGSDGEPITWSIQRVQIVSTVGSNYLYIDEEGAKQSIANGEEVIISIGSSLPSVSEPHIPLAKITLNADGNALAVDGNGNVTGTGYIDLRPSLYVGNLNSYPKVLKNTSIQRDSYTASSWERVIVDTSNGSLIVALPENPTDSDRLAIVDISGTFDRFPVVIRPSGDTKISGSVDDWIINIRDAHVELFYHAETFEWKFEETPGGQNSPLLGTFLSCGGKEFIGERLPEECPDGDLIPAVYPDPPDGVYRYEASTRKCYKEFYNSVAVYANGQGGLTRVPNAPRCGRDPSTIQDGARNIIYVDPSIGDDSISNSGFSQEKPLRSIERALIEAVRESRRSAAVFNNRYDKIVIELAPGDYFVDNSPGGGSVPAITQNLGFIQKIDSGYEIIGKETYERSQIISVDTLDVGSNFPPTSLALGRIIYSESGGVANIFKVEKENASSSIWRLYIENIRGNFNISDKLLYDNLSVVNPRGGGLVVPRGVSINGVDLRKVRVRPMYVPVLTPVQEEPQKETTSIFKLTGGSYVSLITFTDNPQINRSHNTVSAVSFASEAEIIGEGNDVSYYRKINSLFAELDGWGSEGLSPFDAETTIVAPVYDSKTLRHQDAQENQTGLALSDSRDTGSISYPGPIRITEGESSRLLAVPDVNAVRSSSPYVFNCSVRSIFGLNGMHADGSLVSGFKSMVTANFTQVSIQTDPNCYLTNTYFLDPPVDRQSDVFIGKEFKFCAADPLKYRHFGFRGSNAATMQIVSCFVIGNADHFVAETGADLSITNSCSDFGDISLRSRGYKIKAFSQDEGKPSLDYNGTNLTQVIPPLPLSYNRLDNGREATLADYEIDTGLVIDYQETLKYISDNKTSNNSAPEVIRVYIQNNDEENPLSSSNPPSAELMGFGQYAYTRKVSDENYVLTGGVNHPERRRVKIKGFNEEQNAVSYEGDIQPIPASSGGFTLLDNKSKIFIWDSSKQKWYFSVKTTSIVEETTDLDGDGYLTNKLDKAFTYKLSPSSEFASIDFIFDRTNIYITRALDLRTDEERVYRAILEGFDPAYGIRKPRDFYVLEKQSNVQGYPINAGEALGVDPLTISGVLPYREVFSDLSADAALDKYVVYLTKASDSRKTSTEAIFPAKDWDEPENTEDADDSRTKEAIETLAGRTAVSINLQGAAQNPIPVKVRSNSSTNGIPISLHRPSILRASGHTWEWTGYLNYDTALPAFQGNPLSRESQLSKVLSEEVGGKIYAMGMNEEGDFFVGNEVLDLKSGLRRSIDLTDDQEVGNQTFNSVLIRKRLILGTDSDVLVNKGTSFIFGQNVKFKNSAGQAVQASDTPLPSVYATKDSAGLVQFSKPELIRSAAGKRPSSLVDKIAVSAQDLAKEFVLRGLNNITRGIVNLRISLSETSAIFELDQQDSPNIYLHPWNGSEIALLDRDSLSWVVTPIPSEPTAFPLNYDGEYGKAPLPGDTTYDVYVYNSGTIDTPVIKVKYKAWTANSGEFNNDEAADTPPTRNEIDGVLVHSDDPSARFVGVVRTITTPGYSTIRLGGIFYGRTNTFDGRDDGVPYTQYTNQAVDRVDDSVNFPCLYINNYYNQVDTTLTYKFGGWWYDKWWVPNYWYWYWHRPPRQYFTISPKVAWVSSRTSHVRADVSAFSQYGWNVGYTYVDYTATAITDPTEDGQAGDVVTVNGDYEDEFINEYKFIRAYYSASEYKTMYVTSAQYQSAGTNALKTVIEFTQPLPSGFNGDIKAYSYQKKTVHWPYWYGWYPWYWRWGYYRYWGWYYGYSHNRVEVGVALRGVYIDEDGDGVYDEQADDIDWSVIDLSTVVPRAWNPWYGWYVPYGGFWGNYDSDDGKAQGTWERDLPPGKHDLFYVYRQYVWYYARFAFGDSGMNVTVKA